MLEIIKSSTQISQIFLQGARFNSSVISILVYRNQEQHGPSGRVAFVAGKKLGNAVWRNKAKRRMRAICREYGTIPAGFDVVFIAKKSTTQAKYSKVLFTCKRLLDEALAGTAE